MSSDLLVWLQSFDASFQRNASPAICDDHIAAHDRADGAIRNRARIGACNGSQPRQSRIIFRHSGSLNASA